MGAGLGIGRDKHANYRYDIKPSSQQSNFSNFEKDEKSENTPEIITPRVFISFHMNDEIQVKLFRYQAKTSDKVEFTDYSVKEPFDEKWKTQCTERIKQSTLVVVAIGEDTYSREAVLWEIKKAHELGKPVIGMRIHSTENHRIPEPMKEHGDKIIPWKLDILQNEIDRIIKKRDEN